MFECSWIRSVVVAATSVVAVGLGIGLLATSVAAPDPAAGRRPAVLLLPQDGAGALLAGYTTVNAERPGP